MGPLHFQTEGWRKNALGKLKPGDLVVLSGTLEEPTPDAMKGRLLGIMKPSRELVRSSDFNMENRPEYYFDNGEYKWPFGLMNLSAWSLPDGIALKRISNRDFSRESAQGIVPLEENEVARISELKWCKENLLQPATQARERMAKNMESSIDSLHPPPQNAEQSCICVGHLRTPM